MNKLFTKIASLTLGLALASGAGAFIGANVEAKSASAAEATAYTLDGTITDTGSSYAGNNETTQSGLTWIINGNISMNPWRIGSSKNTAAATRLVKSKAAVSNENITKVTLDLSGTFTPNSMSMLVGTSTGASDVDEISGTFGTSVTFEKPITSDWSNKFFTFKFDMPANTTSGTKYFQFKKATFYYESSIPVGTLTISSFSENKVATKGESAALAYEFTPAEGDSATITTATWTSSNENVLSISESTYTAKVPGTFRLTLNAEDSNGQHYEINSEDCFVSNELDFGLDDDVALVSFAQGEISAYELTGINKDGATHNGIATAISDDPTGSYRLTLGEGSVAGSFSLSNDSNYLFWSSGNSLSDSTTLDENTSWFIVAYDDHVSVLNAYDTSREILMNYNNGNPRFACYSANTTYPRSNLVKLAEPLNPRGTFTFDTVFNKTTKQGTSGELTYTWTPNVAAPDATLTSVEFTSSDSAVLLVDNVNSTYQAAGAGKAKITATAVDSLGEEYTASGIEVEVIEVVSGDYVKYTSIKSGDIVSIVCETAKTILSGFTMAGTTPIGTYVFYDTNPGSIYDLTVYDGSEENTFAFGTIDGKYLSWSSGNSLTTSDEINGNSSWTVNFEEGGDVTIANFTDSGRHIRWNADSPRFATYASAQTLIQLYGPEQVVDQTAVNFAKAILNDLTCDESGETAPSTTEWAQLEQTYNDGESVSVEGKAYLLAAEAIEHKTPVTDKEFVEAAMAKYDLVIVKYNHGKGLAEEYPDFITRNPSGMKITPSVLESNASNTTAIIAVTVIAVASISAIAVLLVIKRRKTY